LGIRNGVQSAINQTREFDEIIVIDDGSTDQSPQLLKDHYSSHPKVKLIFKENGGQMSCFDAGYLAAKGDIIFFLDSDDLYSENYLEKALSVYKEFDCDFLFCSHRDFDGSKEVVRRSYSRTIDLGYSVLLATFADKFKHMGSVTSTLSIKREILSRIFPYPFMNEWRIQADKCLIFGASLVGARKVYFDEALVRRRIHGKNLYSLGLDKKTYLTVDDIDRYKNLVRNHRFKNFVSAKMHNNEKLHKYINNEFMTIPEPTYSITKTYIKIILSLQIGISEKVQKMLSVYKCYFLKSLSKGGNRVRFIGADK
jgi:glycosyltransferase involved in cell wall biosynthesis